MTDELKSLIEDAAKLLNVPLYTKYYGHDGRSYLKYFNPCDPEHGDLMKVAEAAKLSLRFGKSEVTVAEEDGGYSIFTFTKGDHQSKVLAILRAASAVLKARGD